MEPKLFDSERRVMQVLWEADAPVTAKEIAQRLNEAVGWNKNTSPLFAPLLSGKQLPPEEIQRLRALIDELE